MSKNAISTYYDALIESYEVLLEATRQAGERGITISKHLTDEFVEGQREALALGKKLATSTDDPADGYAVVLQSALAAQGRALSLAQALTSKALDASTDASETIQKLFAANRKTAEAGGEAFKAWVEANPLAKTWSEAYERMANVPMGWSGDKAEQSRPRAKGTAA